MYLFPQRTQKPRTVIENTEEPITILLFSILRPFPLFYQVCSIWMHMETENTYLLLNTKVNLIRKLIAFIFSAINSSICCRNYLGENFLWAMKSKRKWSVLFLGRKLPLEKSYFFTRVSRRGAMEERDISLLRLIIRMNERKTEGYKISP